MKGNPIFRSAEEWSDRYDLLRKEYDELEAKLKIAVEALDAIDSKMIDSYSMKERARKALARIQAHVSGVKSEET
jgi:hypothetical protein